MISRRHFIAAIVGVCILSASIGTATTLLLAEQGPTGPEGAAGPIGPVGPPGRSADVSSEVSDLQASLDDLDFRVGDLEDQLPFGTVDDLGSRVSDLEFTVEDLCSQLDLICY